MNEGWTQTDEDKCKQSVTKFDRIVSKIFEKATAELDRWRLGVRRANKWEMGILCGKMLQYGFKALAGNHTIEGQVRDDRGRRWASGTECDEEQVIVKRHTSGILPGMHLRSICSETRKEDRRTSGLFRWGQMKEEA